MVLKMAGRRTLMAMVISLLLAGCFCPALTAQTTAPIITSRAVAMNNPLLKDTQILKAILSSKGDVVITDFEDNAVYQFPADGGPMKTLVPQAGSGNVISDSQWQLGNAVFDDQDTLYICTRWQYYILKIPYDPVEKTWKISVAKEYKWATDSDPGGAQNVVPMDITFFPNDKTGNGNFYISEEQKKQIYQYKGTGAGKQVVGGLKSRAYRMAADKAGNVYFVEDLYQQAGVAGVFRIPAGTYGLMGVNKNDGSMEAGWPACGSKDAFKKNSDGAWIQQPCRVDNGLSWGLSGVAVDGDGNVVISDNDSFSPTGTAISNGGIFRVPVENFYADADGNITTTPGSSTTLIATVPNPAHQILLAPIGPFGSVAIDPKGALYVPLYFDPGWNGIFDMAKVYLGSAALAAAPLGQDGTSSEVMVAFNSSVTPDGLALSQAGQAGVDFDKDLATGGTCDTSGSTTYSANQRCTVKVALKSQAVGSTSGVLTMTAGGTAVSATYIHGIGQGSAVSILTPAAEVAIRSGLQAAKQVATDRWGNFYVADAGSGKVLQYLRGSSDSTTPTQVGGSFTAPTGVAVDGAGNVFVGDSGKLFEVPVSGVAPITLLTGLGNNLSLAADGAGNVYIADADNKRVINLPNAEGRLISSTGTIIGTGFTAPTAVTVDDDGNVYVVDGPTLTRIVPTGDQTPLTSGLVSPVGVALDASGAVYVAQQDGVIRIPRINGILAPTGKTNVGMTVSVPNSVAVDPFGTVYMTDGDTPGVVSVGTAGAVDFGFVKMDTTATQTATLFNIGNTDLNVDNPVYKSNTGSAFISLLQPPDDQCSGQTVAAGATCSVGFSMKPTGTAGPVQDSGTIHSNAGNGNILLNLAGVGSNSQPSMILPITYTPGQPVYPTDVTVAVTVAPESGPGTPTGKVVLTVDKQPTRPVLLDGNAVAKFTLRKPLGGVHEIIATYQGDMNYASASRTLDPPLTITQASSTTTIAPPPPIPGVPGYYIAYQGGYNFVVKVSAPYGAPTGTVVFTEGNTQLGTVPLDANGNLTFNTTNLSVGQHTVTATYTGDRNTKGSSANSVSFYVEPPSIVITTGTPSINLTAGTPGAAALVLNPINSFHNIVQLSCANVPQYSECTFDWPTVNFQDVKPAAVVVTISTNVPVNVGALAPAARPGPGLWLATATFAIGLVGLSLGKRTRYNGRVLMVICALLIIASATFGMSACSGNSYTKTPPAPHVTTPSGTQVVTILARDTRTGGVVSMPFQLNVTVK